MSSPSQGSGGRTCCGLWCSNAQGRHAGRRLSKTRRTGERIRVFINLEHLFAYLMELTEGVPSTTLIGNEVVGLVLPVKNHPKRRSSMKSFLKFALIVSWPRRHLLYRGIIAQLALGASSSIRRLPMRFSYLRDPHDPSLQLWILPAQHMRGLPSLRCCSI